MRILHSSTKKKQTAAQEQVQSEKDCFPYQKAYKNGIIRLADQTYTKMYAVPDTQRSADVKKMFLNLLVSFGTSCLFTVCFGHWANFHSSNFFPFASSSRSACDFLK